MENRAFNANDFISDILIIAGPSGSGKGTVISMLPDIFVKSVSATTRAMRSGETEGVDYFFISREQFDFLRMTDNLVEWNKYGDNYYGTPAQQIISIQESGKIPVFDVDVNGARNIKNRFPQAKLVFLLLPSAKEQYERLVRRNENTPEQIKNRIETTRAELECLDMFDRVYINESGNARGTADKILSFFTGQESPGCDYREIAKHYFDNFDL